MFTGFRLVTMVVALAVPSAWAQPPGADEPTVTPVPMGGSVVNRTGEGFYGVYVPTRYGGTLTVAVTSGQIESLVGPDGQPTLNGGEIGVNRHGWHIFKVANPEGNYTVSTRFVQEARAARMPWNYYYWPMKSDAIHEPWSGGNGRVDTMRAFGDDVMIASPGAPIAPGQDIIRAGPNGLLETPANPGDEITWFPNLYDDLTFRAQDGSAYNTPAPLLKYDQLFGTYARRHEAANGQVQDIQRWTGHCLGGAVASIMLNEPTPAPGSGLTRDELKALWCELGENHLNHRIGDNANDIPAGPPRPGLDPTDAFVARFHTMIERHIKGNRKALLANLRAFPPRGTAQEVWNHGVGKYTAVLEQVPGRGERSVRIKLDLHATSGSCLSGEDCDGRLNKYEYIVVYGLNGEVDETNLYGNDWISVGGEAMFAPLNIMEVLESRWQGHNPMVTEANVRSIDLANGSGNGAPRARFAVNGQPPQFRPVALFELGLPSVPPGPGSVPEFRNNGRGGGLFDGIFGDLRGGRLTPGERSEPRRGLFGGLFRGD